MSVYGCCGADANGLHSATCDEEARVRELSKIVSDQRGGGFIQCPRGIEYRGHSQARYHYRVESDGQSVELGFQTHRELIEYLAAIEEDNERQYRLYDLIFPAAPADTPTIRCACGEQTSYGPTDSYCAYCAVLLPDRNPYIPSDAPTIREASE